MNNDTRARIRDGDPSAFAELFDTHARSVYNHAFRLTGDWSVAEDVMAATFLEAWRLRNKVDPDGGSLRPWLLGVATNVARNHCRGNRRYRAAAAAYATAVPEPSVPDHASEVAGRVDDRRRIAATLRALGTLRRTEREVLVLCLWEGLAYTEVARALRVPVGTVRSRLSRARAKLRDGAEAELAREGRRCDPPGPGPRKSDPEKREPAARPRQTTGDRVNAVRPAQEGIR
ncbi:RNA polymerase sigma factor [Streptomyces sp. WAC00288]|uniref:RNA polymerase sigma factor n=1 Tax=unclassified Streptomyces TaxID=2593676 RepID=UPI000788A6D0|nr:MULTISPECIES: RNA polymerase sigma factor [unclassified Streptomyces]AVH94420.1 RNA polymerase sigma factor [Streptomyces sp. WAC00288]KYG53150.1 RNA polymerase subunit sigma [Streptomyces sp. WAC04657]PVC77583.1 RNA polymerase sigma factor [Streptomyces sp. CS081A]